MRFAILLIPFSLFFGFHALLVYRFSTLLSITVGRYTWIIVGLLCLNLPFTFWFIHLGVWNTTVKFWLISNFTYYGIIFFSFWICLIDLLLFSMLPPLRVIPNTFHLGGLLVILGAMLMWGFFWAQKPRVKTVKIRNPKIEKPLKVVQLSDLHIGTTYQTTYIERLVAKVKSIKPDILVITGDLFDNGTQMEQITPFNHLEIPIYFVWGNHDTYFGREQAESMLGNTSFHLLVNDTHQLQPWLQITGLDYMERQPGELAKRALRAQKWNPSAFHLLLSHIPLDFSVLEPFPVDLELAGHTHAGQIWPFNWFVRLVYKHIQGLYQQGNQSIYVSAGTATWGPPIRIGSKCEITEIQLLPITH